MFFHVFSFFSLFWSRKTAISLQRSIGYFSVDRRAGWPIIFTTAAVAAAAIIIIIIVILSIGNVHARVNCFYSKIPAHSILWSSGIHCVPRLVDLWLVDLQVPEFKRLKNPRSEVNLPLMNAAAISTLLSKWLPPMRRSLVFWAHVLVPRSS